KATGAKLDNVVVAKLLDRKDDVRQNTTPVESGKQQSLTLAIDSRDLKPGFHQAIVQFETEPDAWVANNQRFVTFRIQEKPRVLILTEDRKRSAPLLANLVFLNFDAEQATPADSLDYRKYDAIFMTGIASPNENLWSDLAKYVGEGRGLCVIPPG